MKIYVQAKAGRSFITLKVGEETLHLRKHEAGDLIKSLERALELTYTPAAEMTFGVKVGNLKFFKDHNGNETDRVDWS